MDTKTRRTELWGWHAWVAGNVKDDTAFCQSLIDNAAANAEDQGYVVVKDSVGELEWPELNFEVADAEEVERWEAGWRLLRVTVKVYRP